MLTFSAKFASSVWTLTCSQEIIRAVSFINESLSTIATCRASSS
uniref:Uncharacterized protein n=1 Tax=Arundo donax TaxID=35708 RepID=A0A0A9ESJ5_ARUDO